LDFAGSGDDIYLAEGLFAVIEVKSNLTKSKLQEAGKTLSKVKNLKIKRSFELKTANSIDRPLRIVFAYEGATWQTLADEIKVNGWLDLFDLICVLNRGVLIHRGGLISWDGDTHYLSLNSKAASVGYLYYYLVTYATSFLSLGLTLEPYFIPHNYWRGITQDQNE
jgi:hypothetical protein